MLFPSLTDCLERHAQGHEEPRVPRSETRHAQGHEEPRVLRPDLAYEQVRPVTGYGLHGNFRQTLATPQLHGITRFAQLRLAALQAANKPTLPLSNPTDYIALKEAAVRADCAQISRPFE